MWLPSQALIYRICVPIYTTLLVTMAWRAAARVRFFEVKSIEEKKEAWGSQGQLQKERSLGIPTGLRITNEDEGTTFTFVKLRNRIVPSDPVAMQTRSRSLAFWVSLKRMDGSYLSVIRRICGLGPNSAPAWAASSLSSRIP